MARRYLYHLAPTLAILGEAGDVGSIGLTIDFDTIDLVPPFIPASLRNIGELALCDQPQEAKMLTLRIDYRMPWGS